MSVLDPFADLTRLRQHIDRLVDEQHPQAGAQDRGRVWKPAVDVLEDEDGFTMRLDLPGLDRDKLDVQLTGEELVIRGERQWAQPEKGSCIHSERPYGQFHRAFKVGVPVQHEGVQAGYKDGVLTVKLPKAEAVKPRKIAVEAEGE